MARLRDTLASHLARRGVPLKVIRELLGHASIVTTMRDAHLAPQVARYAVRPLGPCTDGCTHGEPAGNPGPQSPPSPAIVVEVANDWRNSTSEPLTN